MLFAFLFHLVSFSMHLANAHQPSVENEFQPQGNMVMSIKA
jgi:hypothetical protein